MSFSNCADRISFGNGILPLQVEMLEDRRLLSTSEPDVILAPAASDETPLADISESDKDAVPALDVPLFVRRPAIPFDDTIDPIVDCPGLDDRFCLPRETKPDPPRDSEQQQPRVKQTDYVFRALIWRTLERIDIDPMTGN